jgi:hypothetical protein
MSKEDGKTAPTNASRDNAGIKRHRLWLRSTSFAAASALAAAAFPRAATAAAQDEVLPRAESPFQGRIGRTVKDSRPDVPKGIEAPAGLPMFC